MYQHLRQLGLTKYESKVYRALLEYGQLAAQEIAHYSGVPPTAVYPNVKSLIAKQLVQHFSGKKSTYQALSPEAALSSFVERKKKQLLGIQQEIIQSATQILHSKGASDKSAGSEVLQFSLGKEASHALYQEFIATTKTSLYILGWRMYTVGDKYSWLQRYKQLIRKNIDVRVIVTGRQHKQWELVRAYQRAGIEIRYLPLENFSLVVCDGKECKITLKGKNLPEKMNLHIQDTDLAAAMQSYFLMSWEKAKKV